MLALSNGYMGLALFDAAPAPLPCYPSASAGHHCSVSSTLSLTGACVAQKEGALARGGLRQATVRGATCSLPPQATWGSRCSTQRLPRSPASLCPGRPPLLCLFGPEPHWRLRCAEGGRSGERGAAVSYCVGGYLLSSSSSAGCVLTAPPRLLCSLPHLICPLAAPVPSPQVLTGVVWW